MTHLWIHSTFLWSENQITLISGPELKGRVTTTSVNLLESKAIAALMDEFHNGRFSSWMAWLRLLKEPGEAETPD